MPANSTNVSIRSVLNRPLLYEELDANFSELVLIIDDYQDFYANEYTPFFDSQTTTNNDFDTRITANFDNFAAHVVAADPHPQYVLKVQNNTTATTDPTVNNDSSEGYVVTSKWYNTDSGEVFLLVDATVGAANWQQTTLTLDDLGSIVSVNVGAASDEIRLNQEQEAFVANQAVVFAIALG